MMLNVSDIEGFDKLPETWGVVFKAFLKNFYARQGMDTRKTIVPQKVALKADKSNGAYLRFDYMVHGLDTWLHVISPNTWY